VAPVAEPVHDGENPLVQEAAMSTTPLPDVAAPARRALAEAGIQTLQDLARQPETTVAGLHGMGPQAMARLRAALSEHGLAFAETEADAEGHPS
jgi:predicted RecB family nuclease